MWRTILVVIVFGTLFAGLAERAWSDTQKHEEMLYTSVRVQNIASDGVGSGTVYMVDGEYSYILAAAHVVENAYDDRVVVTFYPTGEAHVADVMTTSFKFDLALLKVKHVHPYVALVANQSPPVFTEVWNIGAAIGMPVFPTFGIVSRYDAEYNLMQTSAQVVDGMSGGGTFYYDGEHYVMTGVIRSIMTVPIRPTDVQSVEGVEPSGLSERLPFISHSETVESVHVFLSAMCRQTGFGC